MMVKKQYIKTRNTIKLTFEIPKGQLPAGIDVSSVHLVGDFNGWNETANPMKALKSGTFKAAIEIEPGTEIRFRYLANGSVWFNDWQADRYETGDKGEDNCVVVAEK
jgi:1,4-alpha-glucan branching enzyme